MDYATRLLALRRKREEDLREANVADPSFNILLDLFVLQAAGRATTVSDACIASGAPQTTALRRLTRLIDSGFVVRRQDPTNRKRTFVELAPAMRDRLRARLASEAEALQGLGSV